MIARRAGAREGDLKNHLSPAISKRGRVATAQGQGSSHLNHSEETHGTRIYSEASAVPVGNDFLLLLYGKWHKKIPLGTQAFFSLAQI